MLTAGDFGPGHLLLRWLRTPSKNHNLLKSPNFNFRSASKKIPIASAALKDEDFAPDFEQKGVDMRIGLDMANFASDRSVDRIILVTGDTDCLPAMKHCRISGLQVIMISAPKHKLAPELLWHSDFGRPIKWP
jgi:uncharacterized LabA/DUF88 family protein